MKNNLPKWAVQLLAETKLKDVPESLWGMWPIDDDADLEEFVADVQTSFKKLTSEQGPSKASDAATDKKMVDKILDHLKF